MTAAEVRLREARANAAGLRGYLADPSRDWPSLDHPAEYDLLALDAEITRLEAEVARQAAVIQSVRQVCAEHWGYQVRREAKFGRKGSACLCEICQVIRALDEAPV